MFCRPVPSHRGGGSLLHSQDFQMALLLNTILEELCCCFTTSQVRSESSGFGFWTEPRRVQFECFKSMGWYICTLAGVIFYSSQRLKLAWFWQSRKQHGSALHTADVHMTRPLMLSRGTIRTDIRPILHVLEKQILKLDQHDSWGRKLPQASSWSEAKVGLRLLWSYHLNALCIYTMHLYPA
jgi:hypothetical protein